MKKKFKLGVIGAGFMATAIVQGVLRQGAIAPNDIIVSDVNDVALDKMNKLGVNVIKDNFILANNVEFVLFAVKPQMISDVLMGIKGATCDKFISIMAGIKKERIKNVFPNAKIARCMPNTPCSIGSGAVGIDFSDFNSDEDVKFISDLFNPLAVTVPVEENMLNVVTGVSGSSPAYFYLFLKGVIEAGVRRGLTEEQATLLATKTMIGAGNMVLANRDKSIDELINAVCSKGGTTIEAVKTYKEAGLSEITEKAIDACVKRSEELENI
ncbi:MAG: pyrroline-5-carboxylate reductase [Clostridiales bacterium]|nr:pyrroline-5-carboxylate reductase [Clostridiales bacterium]